MVAVGAIVDLGAPPACRPAVVVAEVVVVVAVATAEGEEYYL